MDDLVPRSDQNARTMVPWPSLAHATLTKYLWRFPWRLKSDAASPYTLAVMPGCSAPSTARNLDLLNYTYGYTLRFGCNIAQTAGLLIPGGNRFDHALPVGAVTKLKL